MKSPRQWPAKCVRSGGFGRSGLWLLSLVLTACRTGGMPREKNNYLLTALPTGQWEIELPHGQIVNAYLQHIWPSFAWLTLAFSTNSNAPSASSVRLTVWKHRLSATEWQELRVITARQVAMPNCAVHKGSHERN